jgi:multidrug resistance efflux pump
LELLVTIAYLFAIRLVFFDFKWLRFSLVWALVLGGIYSGAVLTEIILLGQFTPYSKSVFVQRYVIQMGPQIGGEVVEVHAKRGTTIKKGDPLFSLERDRFQYKVDELEASLVIARQNVKELGAQLGAAGARVAHENEKLKQAAIQVELAKATLAAAEAKEKFDKDESDAQAQMAAKGVTTARRAERAQQSHQISLEKVVGARKDVKEAILIAADRSELLEAEAEYRKVQLSLDAMIDGKHATVRETEAQLLSAMVKLKERTVYAPIDGHVINLQLQPGTVVRLKTPVLAFVSSLEPWIVVKVRQKGAQYIAVGDLGEVAFDMYPGKIFPAVVEHTIFGSGNAQFVASGLLPTEQQVEPGEHFFVVMRLTEEHPEFPQHFGAKGIASIYTRAAPDILKVLRKIEIRSESYLNYLYNPF